jgi:hypothetical protein
LHLAGKAPRRLVADGPMTQAEFRAAWASPNAPRLMAANQAGRRHRSSRARLISHRHGRAFQMAVRSQSFTNRPLRIVVFAGFDRKALTPQV